MKVNLHTHTYRCRHAEGTDEEYVLAAIAAGFTKLGFADHTPFPYDNGYVGKSKMTVDELDGYIASVTALKEKYKGQIEILLGLECESAPRFFPFLREVKERMDYLILGNHGDGSVHEKYFGNIQTVERLELYVGNAVTAMESGLFLYMAHPDLMLSKYPAFDDTAKSLSRLLCREANRLNIPLEYNLYGLMKGVPEGGLGYPYGGFWEIAAEENVRAVIGVDAHDPAHFAAVDIDAAEKYLKDLGIRVLSDPMEA